MQEESLIEGALYRNFGPEDVRLRGLTPGRSYLAASAAMWPAKLVTKFLRLVISLTSQNLPVLMADCGDARTAVVV